MRHGSGKEFSEIEIEGAATPKDDGQHTDHDRQHRVRGSIT